MPDIMADYSDRAHLCRSTVIASWHVDHLFMNREVCNCGLLTKNVIRFRNDKQAWQAILKKLSALRSFHLSPE